MSNYTIAITITTRDQMSGPLSNVQRSIGNLTNTTNQHSRALDLNTQSQQNNSTAGRFLGFQMGTLQTAITGAMGAFAVSKVVEWAGAMNEAGMEANATANVFEALIANTDSFTTSAEDMLESLRTATRGIVDDTSLMSGANQLMQMGLANNEAELQRLMNMAVSLKKPYEDAGEAINNFSLMLANQSVQRLDSFGISSAAVRARIDELLASGQALNREEAFKMAVMEEGATAINRMGDSIAQNATAMDRWKTRIDNVMGSVGQAIATTFENAAQTVEVFFGMVRDEPLTEFGARLADAAQGLGEPTLYNEVYNAFADAFQNENPILDAMLAIDPSLLRSTLEERGIPADLADFLNDTLNISLQPGAHLAGPMLDDVIGAFESLRVVQQQQREEEEAAAIARRESAQALFQSTSQWAATAVDNTRTLIMALAEAGDNAIIWDNSVSNVWRLLNESTDEFYNVMDSFQSLGDGTEILDPALAADYREQFDQIAAQVDRLENTDMGFYDEEDLIMLREGRDRMGELADRADAAAEAFERMSLAQQLGQTGGGRLGESGDIVLSMIEDEALRAQMERSFNLASGRETDLSIAVEEQFAPIIAAIGQNMGSEAATAALIGMQDALDTASLEGLDFEGTSTLVQQAIGFDLTDAGELIPVEAVENAERMSASMLESLESAQGFENSDFQKPFDDGVSAGEEFEALLARIDEMTVKPTIQPNIDLSYLPGFLQDMLKAGVQQNGGVVPGEDTRRSNIPQLSG